MQARLVPLARAVTTSYGVGGLKVALDLAGYRGGTVRAPLSMPDANGRAEIARLIEEFKGEEDGATRGDGARRLGHLKGAAS
jgi:dihydrodipicolinate synthase/N-acetylneuraminate lyase